MSDSKGLGFLDAVINNMAMGAMGYWAGYLGSKHKDPKAEERKATLTQLDTLTRSGDHWRLMMRASARVAKSSVEHVPAMTADILMYQECLREIEAETKILEIRLDVLDAEIAKDVADARAKRDAWKAEQDKLIKDAITSEPKCEEPEDIDD